MAIAEKVMQFRLKQEEKERINRGADLRGVNASQFVLRAALKEAEHVEADQIIFALERKQFNVFLSALDADPAPNAALNKLLHTAAPWD
jgi:uncharacterized protein (DUF1778 family)